MQHKIKITNIISVCLLLILFSAISIFLKFPSLINDSFQIKHVIIEGSKKSDKSEIENDIIKFSGNIIDSKIFKIKIR